MKGNPTAGIILMILAAALIGAGFTAKGQQIVDIIFNKPLKTPGGTK